MILKGVGARLDRERALVQFQSWLTGQLVAVGVNAPAKYPPADRIITGAGRRPAQSDAEIERMIRFMHTSTTGETIL